MVNPQLNLIIFGLPKQAICGSSSVVEHQLPKLRVAGSTPVSRSDQIKRKFKLPFLLMSYWVYILYSESTNNFYKGQTVDLKERITRHNSGFEKATRHGVPWQLIWSTEKPDRSSAVVLEQKLKNLSRKRLIEFISKYRE